MGACRPKLRPDSHLARVAIAPLHLGPLSSQPPNGPRSSIAAVFQHGDWYGQSEYGARHIGPAVWAVHQSGAVGIPAKR